MIEEMKNRLLKQQVVFVTPAFVTYVRLDGALEVTFPNGPATGRQSVILNPHQVVTLKEIWSILEDAYDPEALACYKAALENHLEKIWDEET